ncbi:hypothetical protein DY000_02053175 [Brassica cretica]|uniref:Uncharacterized protein n=1 Tax=Brassica cretica TaxID=69181 RepID=A0ABQ7AKI0_BRACR|nr:hypothetical protein DY000_02053175 [Brassica cretica]
MEIVGHIDVYASGALYGYCGTPSFFMLEIGLHSHSAMYRVCTESVVCGLVSHTSMIDSPVTHSSFFPLQWVREAVIILKESLSRSKRLTVVDQAITIGDSSENSRVNPPDRAEPATTHVDLRDSAIRDTCVEDLNCIFRKSVWN